MFIGVCICVSRSDEAVDTYIRAFGLELGYHVKNDDGTFYHSELMKDGCELLDVVEAKREVKDSPVQLAFIFSSQPELENALSILSEGGKIKMDICELPWSPCAAEVVDRFGVDWYLSLPQHLPPEDFTPVEY